MSRSVTTALVGRQRGEGSFQVLDRLLRHQLPQRALIPGTRWALPHPLALKARGIHGGLLMLILPREPGKRHASVLPNTTRLASVGENPEDPRLER